MSEPTRNVKLTPAAHNALLFHKAEHGGGVGEIASGMVLDSVSPDIRRKAVSKAKKESIKSPCTPKRKP